MNIGDPWPGFVEAEQRVLVMQTKLHQWAMADPDRRFDDLANLVYDPAFLVVAWSRVRGNKGARTAGVDGSHRDLLSLVLGGCWAGCEMISKLAGSLLNGCGRRRSRKRRGRFDALGSRLSLTVSCKPR